MPAFHKQGEDSRRNFTFKSERLMPSRITLCSVFISFNAILFEQEVVEAESEGFLEAVYCHVWAAVIHSHSVSRHYLSLEDK